MRSHFISTEVGDFTTRKLFEDMLQDEERHVDLFETHLSAVELVGVERFLAEFVGDS